MGAVPRPFVFPLTVIEVLINDVLDRAKLQEGKVQLEMVSFDLHDVLADSMEILATTAAQKGIGEAWRAHSRDSDFSSRG